MKEWLEWTMSINDEGNFVIEIKNAEGKSIRKIMNQEKTIESFIKKDVIMNFMANELDTKLEAFYESKEKAYTALEAAVSKNKKTPEQQLNLINQIAAVKASTEVTLPDDLHQTILSITTFAEWRQEFLDFLLEEKKEWYDVLIKNYSNDYEKYLELFAKASKKISS